MVITTINLDKNTSVSNKFVMDAVRHTQTLCSVVTLSGGGSVFRGFLLQARLMVDDTTLTGSFSNPASGSQISSCSPPEVRTPQHTDALTSSTYAL